MDILNIVCSIIGGVVASLFTIFLNSYLDKKKLLLCVCEFVDELTLKGRQPCSRDLILVKLQNFDTQIHFRFSKKIAESYSQVYGNIVDCIRYSSEVTEISVPASYYQFLQSIKFYTHMRKEK